MGRSQTSITYGPKDNRVKVFIGSLGGWIRKKIASSLEDEGDGKDDEALVGVVHSCGHWRIIDLESGFLGPSFYHYWDNGDYVQWLREYPKSSHHAYLSDEILNSRSEEYSLWEPCEVLTEEEWI